MKQKSRKANAPANVDRSSDGNKSMNGVRNRNRADANSSTGSSQSTSRGNGSPSSQSVQQHDVWASPGVLLMCALCCGVLNMLHTSTMFENDRQFSHLSDLEREMTFRTEMGFYFSHYKTVVEADSLVLGLTRLMNDNITEHPSVVNGLQRFNIMPEVVIGGMYRGLMAFASWAQIDLQVCWKVARGNNLSPVLSCDGIGVPANFYLWCAWCMAGLTGSLVFLSGALLSGNLMGGVISSVCFFFNHGEATRVMWTPPLRETFAFPFSLLINIVVTSVLRKPRMHYLQALYIALASYTYLVSWQFSQYTLMVTVMVVYFLHTIELIRPLPMLLVLFGSIFGFANCLVSMLGNRMLMTSHLAACLLAIFLMHVTLENVLNWLPSPLNKSLQVSFIFLSTIAMKLELSNWLGMDEDSHVFNILRAKFTNYSDFHTLLYTCSGEFDFLPQETVFKLSQTLLIPVAFIVVGAVGSNIFVKVKTRLVENIIYETDVLPMLWNGIDPGVVYNIMMLFVYCGMASLIMRLKLFMTPQLCIVASLVTCKQYFKMFANKQTYYGTLALLLAVMSVSGVKNLYQQRSTRGSYSNHELEELLQWVSRETTPNSVFAGTMPTMANLMLSTRRPIVNHPHYETAEVRRRTKMVYSVFSRRTSQAAYETLLGLGVNYLVLDENWCFGTGGKPGCDMVDLWDVEEPHNRRNPPLCPQLYTHSPAPFHRVFANDGYVVLQVPSQWVQIPPPKALRS